MALNNAASKVSAIYKRKIITPLFYLALVCTDIMKNAKMTYFQSTEQFLFTELHMFPHLAMFS